MGAKVSGRATVYKYCFIFAHLSTFPKDSARFTSISNMVLASTRLTSKVSNISSMS